jgi:hypothetical protein
MVKKRSTEDLIREFRIVHGDNYDYSKTTYKHIHEKISIICRQHGQFYQLPGLHIKGRGCKKCGTERSLLLTRKTNDRFILDSKNIYGDKYDYSDTNYINADTKVDIKCKIHGKFSVIPDAHIHIPFRECGKCSINKNSIETQWLKSINVPEKYWQHTLHINNKYYKLDAYNPLTNTVYEFYGDFWHGNPNIYKLNDINSKNKKTFGELYKETLERRQILLDAGYNLIEIWETTYYIRTLLKEIKEDIKMKISPENTARLKQLVKDGVQVLQEVEDLKEGLSETVKAIAEELEVKPAIINRLIKDVQKNKMNDRREDTEVLEELYKIAGLG